MGGYSEAQISQLEQNQRLADPTAVQALFIPALQLEHKPPIARSPAADFPGGRRNYYPGFGNKTAPYDELAKSFASSSLP